MSVAVPSRPNLFSFFARDGKFEGTFGPLGGNSKKVSRHTHPNNPHTGAVTRPRGSRKEEKTLVA